MRRKPIARYVLELLAQERRVVTADWRLRVYYCRVAHEYSFRLPDTSAANKLIRVLLEAGQIEQVEGVKGVFLVTAPYSSTIPAPDEVIVEEANPFAVLSNFTAVAYHDLTDIVLTEIYATNRRDDGQRHPVGTTPEDWTDAPRPHRRTPKTLGDTRSVIWSMTKDEWDFGHSIGYVQGYPVYVTDLERTLLDAIRFPDKSGGIRETFSAWRRASELLEIDRLVDYVERFDQGLLRQRVGFLLERLGLAHPTLDGWATRSVRGSSAKLDAGSEFCSTHSERWNLSINVPDSVLSELSDS